MTKDLRVAVIGATGYGGAEVVRLLANHPHAQVVVATSERLAGTKLSHECPWITSDLQLTAFDPESLDVDFAFLAQEAGFAMTHAGKLLQRCKVIDLSADFRLADKSVYAETYKREWTAPELRDQPVYGLPESGNRDEIRAAKLIANPGCHATNAVLGLKPISSMLTGIPVIDSMSGVSGAGRSRKETEYLYSEITGGLKAYAVTGHRHIPEIEQEAGCKIRFTPHLAPMARGIHTTIHAPVQSTAAALSAIQKAYAEEPCIQLTDRPPSTKQVQGTNRVDLHAVADPSTGYVVISLVQDNLVKGAAGQAIQNMNLMARLPEFAGLPLNGLWP